MADDPTTERDPSRTRPCAACGHLNHPDAKFCDGCGEALAAPAPQPGESAGSRPWYRQPVGIVAIMLAILLVGAVTWAVVASSDDESPGPTSTTTATAGVPTTTSPGPATTPAPPDATNATTAPPATQAPPAALAAPTLTAVTPVCDPTADPDAPCTISVTWSHPGGADGFLVVATVQNGPVAGNSIVDDVGPSVRSSTVGPLATGLEECIQVFALRGSERVASGERCISTGIG